MLFDVKQGKSRRVAEFDGGGRYSPLCGVSPDGKVIGAITVEQNLDVILFRMVDGKEISRLWCEKSGPVGGGLVEDGVRRALRGRSRSSPDG